MLIFCSYIFRHFCVDIFYEIYCCHFFSFFFMVNCFLRVQFNSCKLFILHLRISFKVDILGLHHIGEAIYILPFELKSVTSIFRWFNWKLQVSRANFNKISKKQISICFLEIYLPTNQNRPSSFCSTNHHRACPVVLISHIFFIL
jgi:hypothetical protein